MQMKDQADSIRKWLESTPAGPERDRLVGIGMDVDEADIPAQRRGCGPQLPAMHDNRDRRSAEGCDLQPRAAIMDAQQQPGIAAYGVIPKQMQPRRRGQQAVPRNRGRRGATGGGDRAEIIVEKPGREKEHQA
jgi:hypothetical protein